MWQLDNRTPFAAERTWVRDRDGAEIWLVAVRCTFDIKSDGTTEPAGEQPPVVMAPTYIDPAKPAQSSLKYETDLVRTKCTTDVLVSGHAYAPGGKPVEEMDVSLHVGSIQKRLHITGDRVWQGRSPSRPKPFVTMPLVYERAYGGMDPGSKDGPNPQWDERNPVGTGYALSRDRIEGLRLPNIEYPEQLVRKWDHRPPPAGFGPICGHWKSRVSLAGTYDDRWQQERFPLLPLDFDDRYFQSAPVDQQPTEFFSGRETVTIQNLTPNGRLQFQLPQVRLGFETFFNTGERQVHERPKLHSVIIDADLLRMSVVWHTALPCHPKVYKLMKTRIVQKKVVALGPGQHEEEEIV